MTVKEYNMLKNEHYCEQEQRITRLEEKQRYDNEELNKLRESIDKLDETINSVVTQFSAVQGKSNEQELIRGYLIGFIISLGIVFLTHVFRL